MGTVDTSLLQKLVDRAVQERLRPLQDEAWAQHWLLVELVRQLPRHCLLETARRLDLQAMAEGRKEREGSASVWAGWHLYLCQQAGLVDGETLPCANKLAGG